MPKFFEVYGKTPASINGDESKGACKPSCPFLHATCDGGGNRHQTKINISADHVLRDIFPPEIVSVVPAVCAVGSSIADSWVVCPRRLFGLPARAASINTFNECLNEYEIDLLRACGLVSGVEYAAWPEIYLQYSHDKDEVEIDYHFDFVIAEIERNVSLNSICNALSIAEPSRKEQLLANAKKGKYLKGRSDLNEQVEFLPNLNSPLIIEVMTASTSGSNKEKGTNISSAFQNVMLGKPHEGPGINKRQVWGRMATQLFAKTALAENWGGKTIWVVQDQLLKNIQRTTKMKVRSSSTAMAGEFINFATLSYKQKNGMPKMEFDTMQIVESGLRGDGVGTGVDILLPKALPDKYTLLSSVLRRQPTAFIRL